jgi:hypothetical protein
MSLCDHWKDASIEEDSQANDILWSGPIHVSPGWRVIDGGEHEGGSPDTSAA